MNSLDDKIREYIESMNSRNNPRIVLKKFGINANEKRRILLYATEGIKLSDYAVFIQDVHKKTNFCYRFPDNRILSKDTYICLFLDESKCFATMRGERIPSFHCEFSLEIQNGDTVILLSVNEIDKLVVEGERN